MNDLFHTDCIALERITGGALELLFREFHEVTTIRQPREFIGRGHFLVTIFGRRKFRGAFFHTDFEFFTGFGELFRQVSYDEIGASTIQSRCVGGIANATLIFDIEVMEVQ